MKIVWNKVTWYSVLLAVIVFMATLLIGIYIGVVYQKYLAESNDLNRIRKCPTEWYEDRMPTIVKSLNEIEDRQVFVINGERRSSKEVDTGWVRAHCDIKPIIVE
jgi:hypothetical protein